MINEQQMTELQALIDRHIGRFRKLVRYRQWSEAISELLFVSQLCLAEVHHSQRDIRDYAPAPVEQWPRKEQP